MPSRSRARRPLLSFIRRIVSSVPSLHIDRSPLREHVEAAAKRARFDAAARARALTGAVPPSVEGTDRGLDVLSYDISFDVDPAIRFLSGTTVIRVAGTAARTTSLALDFDDAYTVTATTRDGLAVTATHAARKARHSVRPAARRHGPRDALRLVSRPSPGGVRARLLAARGRMGRDERGRAVPRAHVLALRGRPEGQGRRDRPRHRPGRLRRGLRGHRLRRRRGRRPEHVHVEAPPGDLDVPRLPERRELRDRRGHLHGDRRPDDADPLVPPARVRGGNVARLSEIKNHIATQASMFGEYPFVDTKYGIVASSFSGGMEHPTLTSIGTNILANTAPRHHDPSRARAHAPVVGRPGDDADVGRHLAQRGVRDVRRGPVPREGARR